MNSFAKYHRFVGCMYRFLLCGCYLGCFRISEKLALTWSDLEQYKDEHGNYVTIRMRWHKKANVEKDCQVYILVDENSFPCLKICGIFDDYIAVIRALGFNIPSDSFAFPNVSVLHNRNIEVDWCKHIEQNNVRSWIQEITKSTPSLPIGISLHSMRRGGCFYRIFESPQRKFNFRELMAWCRWADAKTCCEYLVTHSISREIDPINLLRCGASELGPAVIDQFDVESISNAIVKRLQSNHFGIDPSVQNQPPPERQQTLDAYVKLKILPTARSGREAWDQ